MFPALKSSQFHVGDSQVNGQSRYHNLNLIKIEMRCDDIVTVIDCRDMEDRQF